MRSDMMTTGDAGQALGALRRSGCRHSGALVLEGVLAASSRQRLIPRSHSPKCLLLRSASWTARFHLHYLLRLANMVLPCFLVHEGVPPFPRPCEATGSSDRACAQG